MAIQPNYLARGGDPYAGQAAINEDAMASIGTALFGNPQVAGQRALRTAQAEQIGLENERARRGLTAGDEFGGNLARAFTVTNPDGSTRPATLAEVTPRLGDLFKSAYWANGADPAKAAAWMRAFTGLTGNEDLSRAGFVAAGGAPNENYAATTGRADQVHQRNAASDKDRATAVAGIGAGATLGAARIREQGETGRQESRLKWDAANPTFDRARAQVLEPWLNDPLLAPEVRAERQETVINPGMATARERARGQEAAANARADGNVRVAEIRGVSAENVARLVQEGRVTAADIAAHARVKAAETTAGATVTAADRAASARVEAAVIGLQGTMDTNRTRQGVADTAAGAARDVATTGADGRVRAAEVTAEGARDVAATRAGAPKPAIAVPTAVAKGWDTEIDALVGESNFSVNDEGKLWLKQRAGEVYQQPGPAQRNGTAAMRQAWEDYKAADPGNTRGLMGRMLFSPRYGAPAAPGGSPALVPAPAAPTPGGPPPAAIDMLRKNPGMAPQFDQKYGPGAADRALRGA